MLGRKFLCLLSGVLCMLKCIYLDIYLPSSLIPAELCRERIIGGELDTNESF